MSTLAVTGFLSIQSNVTELLAGLCARVDRDPAQVLARELVVVSRPGMDRWLSQFLAGRHAVAWDLQSIPLRKLWVEVARASGSSFRRLIQASPSKLRFRILEQLGQLDDSPVWAPILPHCRTPQRAFEFAQVQASLFEEYLSHRLDTLRAWEAGEDATCWQAQLWRCLWPEGDGTDAPASPAMESVQLLQKLAGLDEVGSTALRQALGPRVHVFGCTEIPAASLALMRALGAHLELRLYRLVPSQGFLGQTQDEHPLLHAWSAGYTKASLSLEALALRDEEQLDHFLDPTLQVEQGAQHSDLDRVCQSLYSASAEELSFQSDASLQIHGCAGMMREVEVLHDRIASALLEFPHWSYEDVVVWVSDLSTYAPYIEAVFAPVEPASGPQIPYRIVDRHQSPRSPALLTLFHLLESFSQRSTRETLIDLMGLDPIKLAFGWSDEILLRIEAGIDQAQIRWGQNAEQRALRGQPLEGNHSWEQGLWRWVLGCAYQKAAWADETLPLLGTSTEPFLGGGQLEAESLGQLARFLDLYFRARTQAGTPASLEVWIERTMFWLEQFVPPAADARGLEQLRACLLTLREDQLQSGALALEYELETFVSMLDAVAQITDGAALWGRGGVTFAQLQSARPVPANMVVLLGMGEGQFPRNQRPPSWSKRVTHPVAYELRQRDEDRMAMMESLLCARKRWICLYSSRDLRGEHAWSPSPLVQELKAFLGTHARPGAASVEVEHPLSSFEPTAWGSKDARRVCHQSMAWQVAQAQVKQGPTKPVLQAPLPDEELGSIELQTLLFYLVKPSAAFLQRRLGAVADADQEAWTGTEPGVLARLERFKVADAVLEAALAQVPAGELEARLSARGLLPWGQAGLAALKLVQSELGPLVNFAKRELVDQAATLETWTATLDCETSLGSVSLVGQVQGRLLDAWRWILYPAKLNAKRRLRAWVEHLFLSAGKAPGYAGTQVLGVDKKNGLDRVAWAGMDAASARLELSALLELYLLGQRWPLPIFLESSLAYAKAVAKQKSHLEAIASARSKYDASSQFGVNESAQDWATQRLFSQSDALVEAVAAKVLGAQAPVRWAEHGSDFAAIAMDLWSKSIAQEVRQ